MALPDIADRLINEHFLNYAPYKPSDLEYQAMQEWAHDLDEDILTKVLDFERHPEGSSGTKIRPKFGDLKSMVFQIKREQGAFRRQENQSLTEGENCFYCNDMGLISWAFLNNQPWDFTSKGFVSSRVITRCECRHGDESMFKKRKPAMPQKRAIERAQQDNTDCPWALELIIYDHDKSVKQSPGNLGVPEHLKGLPEHKGTESEGLPF